VRDVPLMAVPVILVWALLYRFARTWAVPGALVAAVIAIAVSTPPGGLAAVDPWPVLSFTPPVWSLPAMVSLALPLFIVTMASQNVPGMAVLAGYGYRPRLRGVLLGTGLASATGAFFGGHAINMAAITAALAAGPDAGPDPARRWIASVTAGFSMIVLGLGAGLATALVLLSPPVLIEAVAGLALLGALASSVAAAFADASGREGAVVTFVVAVSGVTFFGIGSAFWGLVAGGLMHVLTLRRTGSGGPSADQDASLRSSRSTSSV
jgi:benzoate membrane transport protein